jgi:hypothetical protein
VAQQAQVATEVVQWLKTPPVLGALSLIPIYSRLISTATSEPAQAPFGYRFTRARLMRVSHTRQPIYLCRLCLYSKVLSSCHRTGFYPLG